MLSFKYKLLLNQEQTDIIISSLSSLTNIWNDNVHISSYTKLSSLSKNYKENKYLYAQSKQQLLKKLSLSWKSKITNKTGKPQTKDNINYILYPQVKNFHSNINDKAISYICLPKIGELSFFKHNDKELKDIKQILLKKEEDKYYIIFFCNYEYAKQCDKDKSVGIDIGFKTYLTLSDKKQIKLERYTKRYNRIKRLQNHLSKKIKGSHNYNKVKSKINKEHLKISNKRKDSLHKITTLLSKQYNYIMAEDIKSSSFINSFKEYKKANKAYNQKIYQSCFDVFFQMLSYKTNLIKVEAKNTSKMCYNCKNIKKELGLNDREYNCLECGYKEERDINASLNILHKGLLLI